MHKNIRERQSRQLYETWVRDYAQELFAFAFRLCGDAAQAEDMVQETYYEAWRSMKTLRDPQSGRAWLFRILRFRYAHWRRDSGRRVQPKVSLSEIGSALAAPQESVEDALAGRELLQKALDSLDDGYKEPFLMVFQQGLTCREAAEALEIPLGTVLSRIHRARKALRAAMRGLDWTLGFRSAPHAGQDNGHGRPPRRFRVRGDS
jgi:RNA polymerase sigma-70 factor (ECF subfamily)